MEVSCSAGLAHIVSDVHHRCCNALHYTSNPRDIRMLPGDILPVAVSAGSMMTSPVASRC